MVHEQNPSSDHRPIEVKLRPTSPLLGEGIPYPRTATEGSAGVDLHACVESTVYLEPGESTLISSGISIELPGPHVAAFLFARSGLAARHGIRLANGVGVIDSDYRGEIKVALRNDGDEPFLIRPGDRIAQMVLMPVYSARWLLVDELDDTPRGSGGFGHSGL